MMARAWGQRSLTMLRTEVEDILDTLTRANGACYSCALA
jgi:hypothetical protein